MRAPNGYGTVCRIDKKPRRKPWVFRVTVGYKPNNKGGLSPIVETIGTYETKREAFAARDEYNRRKAPGFVPTFAEIADEFEAEHYPEISEATQKSYSASRVKCSTIAFKAVSAITYADLQEVINNAKPSTQKNLKVYLNLIFKDALRKEYIERNPAELLKVAKTEKSTVHFRYTPEEIRKLWTVADTPGGAFALLTIYTGARHSELLSAEREGDVLKVRSGKTAAATRLIPIHPDAVPLLKFFPFQYETYYAMQKDFRSALKKAGVLEYINTETGLKAKHKPHDGRHTFTSQWKAQRLDDGIRAYVQGHTQKDIGGRVYTHYDIDYVREEVDKLDF